METQINIKLTEEQKEMLSRKAKEMGLTISAYIRLKALS